jgi:hypothetical protein
MKKLAKKSLSMLLVFILALSACVSAIAYDTGSEDVTNFYASVNAYGLSPKLNWLHLLLDSRFTAFDEEAFAFTLEDSTGRLVADETMGHVETFTPAENDGFGFEVYFYFNNQSLPVLNAAESYTLTVPAGIFTAGSEQNEQLIVTFEASEFINLRTGFLGFLDRIYNTPVLRVIFAPFIGLIEFIYYISVFFAFL